MVIVILVLIKCSDHTLNDDMKCNNDSNDGNDNYNSVHDDIKTVTRTLSS